MRAPVFGCRGVDQLVRHGSGANVDTGERGVLGPGGEAGLSERVGPGVGRVVVTVV